MRADSIKSFFAGLGKKNAAVDAAASMQPENEVTDMSLFESSQNIKSGMPEMPVYSASAAERRRAQAVYDDWTRRFKKNGAWADKVTITPALAEVLLERNPMNRKLTDIGLGRLVADMKDGLFKFNGQSITIADTGELNDGQHRLTACVMAGKAFETTITYGALRESRTTVDQGIRRTISSQLTILGYTDANHVAHACRVVWQLANHGRLSTSPDCQPTVSNIADLAADIIDVLDLSIGRKAYKAKLGAIGLHAALHYWLKTLSDDTTANAFYDPMITGIQLGKRSPIYVLRNALITRDRLKEVERAAFTIKAWNAWRAGRSIGVLKFMAGEEFPRVE